MTAFDYLSEVGVALGHGGSASLLLFVVVGVETHQKVILERVGIGKRKGSHWWAAFRL